MSKNMKIDLPEVERGHGRDLSDSKYGQMESWVP
jgi:hypothetical protein